MMPEKKVVQEEELFALDSMTNDIKCLGISVNADIREVVVLVNGKEITNLMTVRTIKIVRRRME